MSNEEVKDAPLVKQMMLAADDFCPGLVVNYDGRPQQVRGISAHATRSIGTDEHTVTQHDVQYCVVFCDVDGRVTTATLQAHEKFEVRFIEVFEPGVPAGYVSRKKFKRCYEDALASTENAPPRIVNNGSQWRSKQAITRTYRDLVPEGTVCTVYALSTDQTSCRLMLPSGGDLGNIGLATLQLDFYYVGEQPFVPGAGAGVDELAKPQEEPVLVNSEWELKDQKEANPRGVGRRRWVISVDSNHGFPLYEMADKHGTSLGRAKLENMRKYYTFVKNDSKPSATIKVKLTYFKPSGKYYSEGEYQTGQDAFWKIVDEVYRKLTHGDNPGLVDKSVLLNDFTTTITIEDELLGIPHVITAQALCAEIMRKSKGDALGYSLSIPKEALDFYMRHQPSIVELSSLTVEKS